jgi:biotin operon repressor
MSNGFIQLHRRIIDWEWYDDVPTKVLFIHMLLKANHKEGNWRGVKIPKGSFISGRKILSQETGLSEQQIRTSIDKLKSTSELTIKTTNKYSMYSMVKWDSYQGNQPAKSHSSNQQSTTNNNDNNDNKTIKGFDALDGRISKEVFQQYINDRKNRKKPMTELAIQKAINKINGFAEKGYDCNEIINKTIISGWSDFFEPKDKPKQTGLSAKDLDNAYN